MAATPRILLCLFTSILILCTILFCYRPLSSSPLVSIKALSSIFDHNSQPHSQREVEEEAPSAFEKDVVVLTKNNFTEFIARNRYVMVKFYAPWCYWSQKLAPEYAAAATMLKSRAILAMVDCTAEAELGRKFHIQGYPTMYLFVGGDKKIRYDFTEERTRDTIANWVYQKMNNVVQNLTSVDEAEGVLASKSLLVLGFLHSLQGEESEELLLWQSRILMLTSIKLQVLMWPSYSISNRKPNVPHLLFWKERVELIHMYIMKVNSPN